MSKIALTMRPNAKPIGWEEFCETHDPYTISLNGYVASRSRLDRVGPRLNLDHRADISRLASRASCAQTLVALRQGLFDYFRDGHGPRAQVCVNDCDEDICTSWFLLKNADLATTGQAPRLDALVNLVDVLHTTGGVSPLPADLSPLKELAWVFAPYYAARRKGDWDRRQSSERSDIMAEVTSRLVRHLAGRGDSFPLDGRYVRLGGGPGWTLIRDVGAQARIGAMADGVRAYVSVRERSDGRWAYVVGRTSPFVPFDVPAILHALDLAEGPGIEGWGGSNLVGGSPRVRGSKLSPDEVEQLINELRESPRVAHGLAVSTGKDVRAARRPRAPMAQLAEVR